jgi:DNA-binding NarL/FixJ family response regulator
MRDAPSRARCLDRGINVVLHPLRLGPVAIDRARYLPPLLLPLVRAAARGDDIVPEIETVVRAFGFDSFMYATANYHLRPDNDERMYVFTTLPREWVGLAPTSEGAPLSSREKHCLQLASHGLTSAEIASRLGIVDRTVNFHFANILSKLAARNRHEAIAKAATLGLLASAS